MYHILCCLHCVCNYIYVVYWAYCLYFQNKLYYTVTPICNALVHVINSGVSGQRSHTIVEMCSGLCCFCIYNCPYF